MNTSDWCLGEIAGIQNDQVGRVGCVVVDESHGIALIFVGRRRILYKDKLAGMGIRSKIMNGL